MVFSTAVGEGVGHLVAHNVVMLALQEFRVRPDAVDIFDALRCIDQELIWAVADIVA